MHGLYYVAVMRHPRASLPCPFRGDRLPFLVKSSCDCRLKHRHFTRLTVSLFVNMSHKTTNNMPGCFSRNDCWR